MACRQETPEEELASANKRIHFLTDLLCKQCSILAPNQIHEDVVGWWTDHLKADARRIASEEANKQRKIKQLEAELKKLKG